ncbi:Uncharacterised protein g3145 [Pycnogonum litorale]
MTAKDVKRKSVLTEWLSAKIPRIGIWFAVLGALLFSVSEACAKLIANDVTAEVIISVRHILHGFVTVPFLLRVSGEVYRTGLSSWIYAIAGGLAAGLTSYTANYSYHYIPLLDSFVLLNSQPVFAAAIAFVWLKEKLTLYDIGIMTLTMVGVVIACQPTFIFGYNFGSEISPTARTIGSALGLAGAVSSALVTCFSRKIRYVDSSIIVYLQGLAGVIIGFVGGLASSQLYISETLTPVQIMALVSTSVFGYIARTSFTISVQTEDATLVAVLQTLEIPFSFLLQMVILDTYPNSLSTLGAIIVMVGTALLSWKENVKKKAKNLKESFKSQFRPTVKIRNSTKNADEKTPLVGDSGLSPKFKTVTSYKR